MRTLPLSSMMNDENPKKIYPQKPLLMYSTIDSNVNMGMLGLNTIIR
jgi:hypothetical protein